MRGSIGHRQRRSTTIVDGIRRQLMYLYYVAHALADDVIAIDDFELIDSSAPRGQTLLVASSFWAAIGR